MSLGSELVFKHAQIVYLKSEIKKELGQTVPIEFKDAPSYTCNVIVPRNQPDNVTITHVGFLGVRQGKEPAVEPSSAMDREMEPADDDCPF